MGFFQTKWELMKLKTGKKKLKEKIWNMKQKNAPMIFRNLKQQDLLVK